MAFNRPTLQQIADRIISDFQSRITNGSSLLRRSFVKIASRVYAGALHLLYGYLSWIKDQIFATTADTDDLNTHGNEVSIIRIAAIKATGSGVATGTDGINIPAGSELQSGEGKIYLVDLDAVIAGGAANIDFTAQTADAASNDDGGIELTFVSPISGVNTIVTVDSSGITGGADEEDDDSYRERILARKRTPPHGGTEFDYVNWCKEVSGVTRVWTFPQYQGAGTIGVAFVRDNDIDTFIPDEAERNEVYNYLLSHTDPISGDTIGVPVTAQPGLFVLELTSLTINIQIAIFPNTSTVRASVISKITDFIDAEGGPGETLYLSRLSEVISQAVDEERHRIISPASDVTVAVTQVPVIGTITFTNY